MGLKRENAGVITCVLDGTPLLHEQLLRWFSSLRDVAGVAPSDLSVVAIDTVRSPALDYLALMGVRIDHAGRVDERSSHCNKIRALQCVARTTSGVAVLSDCDVAFVVDPRVIDGPPGSLSAKHVDGPNPPVSVLYRVLKAADLSPPPEVALEPER